MNIIDLVSPVTKRKKKSHALINLVSSSSSSLPNKRQTRRTSRSSSTPSWNSSHSRKSASTKSTNTSSSHKKSSSVKRSSSVKKSSSSLKKSSSSPRRSSSHKRSQSMKNMTTMTTTTKEKNSPRETINRFFKTNLLKMKMKIRAKFLKSICSDSGVCIAFGKETNKIKEFFDNFVSFKYVVNRRRVGAPSINGFVYEITYQREGYTANAILKSSTSPDSDNLAYEYLVGTIINKNFYKKFPCFVETYGIYKYDNTADYETMSSGLNQERLRDIMMHYPNNSMTTAMACDKSKFLSLLIQNIKEAKTMKSMLEVENNRTQQDVNDFVQNDLIGCLYQIYFVLKDIHNYFTHYDLHYTNVLLFEPVAGKYLKFTYTNSDNRTCTFKSRYIVKIIDYGRSFIQDPRPFSNKGSVDEYTKVCNAQCPNVCGDAVGYAWLDPAPNEYGVNSTMRNMSHDLWLLKILGDTTQGSKNKSLKMQVFDKVLWPKKLNDKELIKAKLLKQIVYLNNPENNNVGYPNKINNVCDAAEALYDLLTSYNISQQNNIFYPDDPNIYLGELVIRSGHDIVYNPAIQ